MPAVNLWRLAANDNGLADDVHDSHASLYGGTCYAIYYHVVSKQAVGISACVKFCITRTSRSMSKQDYN